MSVQLVISHFVASVHDPLFAISLYRSNQYWYFVHILQIEAKLYSQQSVGQFSLE